MPVLSTDDWNIDYVQMGTGSPVVLIHSSVSGNQQWRSLAEALKDSHRVLAVNLFGYGDTTPWPKNAVQTLAHHADLVLALCSNIRGHVFSCWSVLWRLGGAESSIAPWRQSRRSRVA